MNEDKGCCGGSCGNGGSCSSGACGSGGCGGGACGGGMKWHGCGRGAKKVFMALALLMLAVWLGFKARNEARMYDFIGVPIERNTIVVSGEGKVVGIPDVAGIDLGTTIEKKTVAEAQQENTRIMNQVIASLKSSGVDAKDIQTTAYSVYPAYDWTDNKQVLRGYTVSQNVHVKIRNLDNVGDIVGKAGGFGANQIGGIQFSVDDPEKLKDDARAKALENAKAKAAALAASAGVKLRRVVSFDENPGTAPRPIFYDKAMGLGGAAPEAAPAPNVEAGSTEIVVDVNLTYEIE